MNLFRRVLTLACAFACISTTLQAETLTIDHILSMRQLGGVTLSPDGSRVLFVVNEPRSEENSRGGTNSDLYIIPTAGGEPVRLTSNPGRDSSPQWFPDGSAIAFQSDRPGKTGSQIYAIAPTGGKARQLSHHPVPIRAYAWSPSGKEIAYLARRPVPKSLAEKRRRGDDAIVLDSFDTDENAPFTRLWILDVDSGKSREVPVSHHVTRFVWSPDGSQFLLVITDDANLDHEWTRSRIAVVPATGGKATTYCATKGKLGTLGWLPDGKGISFVGASANGTEQAPSKLFVCRGVGNTPVSVTKELDATVQGYRWLDDTASSALLTFVERNTRYLGQLTVNSGKVEKLSQRPHVVSDGFSLSDDGKTLACMIEKPDAPRDIWTGELGGPLRQITHLNPALEALTYGAAEEFDWSSRDAWDITGVLIKPVGYKEGQRYPMIVQVHGGPESVSLNGFQISWAQLFAANGYATFLPNYRGSIGRGVEYTIANHGDRGGNDFFDIMDGVDALVERGIADRERLAIGGWSYGGFMSSWAVTQTNRFKASVVGMGITNWFSLMSMCPVAIWNAEAHFLAWHYDDPEVYWRFSPVLHVKKVKTPTLLLFGERDPFIPPAQGRQFFRGLRYYDVPSEMVVYPREGHGLGEPLHRRDAYERVLRWYAQYVN